MDSPKIYVGPGKFGVGVHTIADIDKDEFITEFDGPWWEAERISQLPTDEIISHCLQIARNRWAGCNGAGWFLNHSCEPNAGIRGTRVIVAMRKILAGEEIFFDYEMTERSDFQMLCECGCASCRKLIGSYDNLPREKREQYGEYVSQWIRDEERHMLR